MEEIKLGWGYYARDFCLFGLVIVLVITTFLFIMNNRKCKRCVNENRKEQLHKWKNKTFLIGLGIIIVLTLIIMILNLVLPRYSVYN